MRRRPTITREDAFIAGASIDELEELTFYEDLHQYVHQVPWPLIQDHLQPSVARGSRLKKPLLINTNEQEWNTIDRHTKALGVAKAVWIKHAIFKLLHEEQHQFQQIAKTEK